MASAASPSSRRSVCCIPQPSSLKPVFAVSENHSNNIVSVQIPFFHRRPPHRSRIRLSPRTFSYLLASSHINPLRENDTGKVMGIGRRGGGLTAVEDEDGNSDGELKEGCLKDVAGGREDVGDLVHRLIAAMEETLPAKDLVTLASCIVGLLTGFGVVLFNQSNIGDLTGDNIGLWEDPQP